MNIWRKAWKLAVCAVLALTTLGLAEAAKPLPAAAAPLYPNGVTGPGKLPGVAGFISGDRNPAAGPLASFGATGAFALDSGLNSIGVDLGSAAAFDTIELRASSAANRVEKSDLSLYTSADNVTYTKVADWDFLKLGGTIVLYNFGRTARYVKVHGHFDDNAPEYGGPDLQEMIGVYDLPPGRWTASGGSDWLYRKPVAVTNPNGETIYDRAVYMEKEPLGVPALIASGKLQADFRDVRFAGEDGRELPFYMDDDGFFVRLPVLQPHESTNVYLYYGNPDAAFVGAGQEALQVEYGNKTLTEQGVAGAAEFGANIKPVRLKDGTLLLMAQTDKTRGIYARYSLDDGRTWSAPEPFVSPGSRSGVSLDSPGGAYVDPVTGTVYVVFYSYHYFGVWDGVNSCLDASVCRSDLYMVKSTGFSGHKPVFGTPVPISGMVSSLGHPVNYAVTYSNPIRLSSGRLVVTFGFVIGNDGTFAAGVAYSDDDGATWTKSASDLTIPSSGGEGGVSETAIVELADGTLKIYARQQRGDKTTLGTSVSTDGGTTWSAVQDSDIMSSNTFPALGRDADGSVLLSWSGHNAMGGSSYQRNNLTVAYSGDETATWHGYRDVLGRTRLSAPGWHSEGERNRAVEADKVPAGDDAYLFSWSGGTMTGTLLVEDFYRYLYRSHGALDDFEYERSGTVPDNGSRLANDYWWKTASPGVVATSADRAKRGARSLRLYDSVDNITMTGASRLFPAVRKGSVRFSVYGASFANGLHMSLQEGFSQHWNAAGTAFSLRVSPDGALTYSSSPHAYARKVGYAADDTNPAVGNLGNFGYIGSFALDYKNRSIGVDLGRIETVTEIKLYDNDGANRIAASNLSVYASETNDGDWRLVTGWTFGKANGTITLGGLSVQARYVKVHQNYGDTAFTFVNGLQDMMETKTAEPFRRVGFLTDDTNPASGNLGSFGYAGMMGFDYKSRSVGVDLGGIETIEEIKLWDNDGANRLTAGDLSVYVSDTNSGDWTPVAGWTFAKSNGNITLGGLSVAARFVKVHSSYADTAFTFANETRDILTVQTAERRQRTGFISGDANPTTGNLGQFGYAGAFALDYQSRSVGVDLGRKETVTSITLRDTDASSRLTAADLSVYVSDANAGDWTLVTGWTFQKANRAITIGGLSVDARYVKVHQSYADTGFTFANELRDMMTVRTVPVAQGAFRSLPVATSLPLNVWSDIRVDFDLPAGEADVYVNGDFKGRVPASHPGPVVTHFLLATGAGSGTDAYVDEFIVQDTSVGLPEAGSVGAEQSAVSFAGLIRATELALNEPDSPGAEGLANALAVKLRHAEQAWKEGKRQAMHGSLRAYMQQVRALGEEGKIGKPDILVRMAESLL
ncbi:exo-alpha-sialidase [Paenibacillus flagellatus]|nr:exo-alpha-sialidase [Paenibacillus flagellatus]